MNRNQSESIERVDETKPRARRSLAAIGDVDDASERGFASRTARTTERRNRWNRANARSRGKSTHTKIRGSRLVNHDSRRAGPFFPAPTRARVRSKSKTFFIDRIERCLRIDRGSHPIDRSIDRRVVVRSFSRAIPARGRVRID